jgi:hypothetical protein
MIRKEIKLNSEQHCDLCSEEYLEIDGKEVSITIVENKYSSGTRHTEIWEMIFKLNESDEYYLIGYEKSVKDSMGWDECNWASTYTAKQVFPKKVETIIYE